MLAFGGNVVPSSSSDGPRGNRADDEKKWLWQDERYPFWRIRFPSLNSDVPAFPLRASSLSLPVAISTIDYFSFSFSYSLRVEFPHRPEKGFGCYPEAFCFVGEDEKLR